MQLESRQEAVESEQDPKGRRQRIAEGAYFRADRRGVELGDEEED